MKKKKDSSHLLDLGVRYALLVLCVVSFGGFLFVFRPATIYPVFFFFELFYGAVLDANTILVGNVALVLVDACIAPAAYALLCILNFATPSLTLKRRITLLVQGCLALLIFNIARIIVLGVLYLKGSAWFDLTHVVFWYALSVLFVVGIWVYQVKKNNIRAIPFFTDVNALYKKSVFKKK